MGELQEIEKEELTGKGDWELPDRNWVGEFLIETNGLEKALILFFLLWEFR